MEDDKIQTINNELHKIHNIELPNKKLQGMLR